MDIGAYEFQEPPLQITAVAINGSGLMLTWQSVAGRMYAVEYSTNCAIPQSFLPLVTNIVGQAGTTTHTDSSTVGTRSRFYRVAKE